MVLDSSALIAILNQESDARQLAECIELDPVRFMSTANWLETQIVMNARFGSLGAAMVDTLFRELRIQLVPLDVPHAHAAMSAWQRFGKGRNPAALNFGDCCAYATAVLRGDRLLFKGGDFVRTDVISAL